MANLPFQLQAVMQRLEGDYWLGEALFVPEVSRLGTSTLRLQRALTANARGVLERAPLAEILRRHAPLTPEVREFEFSLPAPRELPLWRDALPLRFKAACWRQADAWVAYLPQLGLEVIAPDETELSKRVSSELAQHFEVMRLKDSLYDILFTQRCLELLCQPLNLEPDIATPKERAVTEARGRERASVLREVAIDLTQATLETAHERQIEVRLLAQALGQPAAESVLLVGPSGVGKTAIFRELVRQRESLLFGATPFWATSGSRIVAGMSGFGMWQQRCDDLRREASSTRAIVHLGNLVELMEVGKGTMIRQGVAGFLRPFIVRGELQCVVECTPEQLPRIEAIDPHLLGAFKRIEINEPTSEAAQAILLAVAHELANHGPDRITIEALQTLDRLHRRYATYSAYPGRPLRFLRNLLADRTEPAGEADVYQAFTRETGMPRELIDTGIALEPVRTLDFFSARVMGQPQALSLVTDLLATVKAGLVRPRRPLASYLFVGPTGVGKTETAKALAEFLFGDARRMTRFDMSEYAGAGGVQRLIGGATGDEGLLTAALREQPFCVLLLDEFEKAHHSFFDLLLQVLGEARLTDGAGRLADFRNAVVIMTSNLGAESFMQGAIGFARQAVDARGHFTRALERFVRPELINRIDSIVPFSPLPPDVVRQIAIRELENIRRRPGLLATGARFHVDESVIEMLAAAAYRPELGARPLKREMAAGLLAPLAEALNTQSMQYALDVHASLQDGALRMESAPLLSDGVSRARAGYDHALGALAQSVAALRRNAQKANAAPAVLAVRNNAFRIERALEQQARLAAKGRPVQPVADAALLPAYKSCGDAFQGCLDDLAGLEDDVLLGAFGRADADTRMLLTRCAQLEKAWREALRKLMRLGARKPDHATLWVYSHNNDLMFDLARAYFAWASARDARCRVLWATHTLDSEDARDMQSRAPRDTLAALCLAREARPALFAPRDGGHFLAEARGERGAVVLSIEALDVFLSLAFEAGLHRFRHDLESQPLNVEVRVYMPQPLEVDLPSPGGVPEEGEMRRRYELAQRQAHDTLLDSVATWTGRALEHVLERCVDDALEQALRRQVGL